MNTVAVKNTMAMNNEDKQISIVERFKKYLVDNAEYFSASAAVISGNGYAATQIMRNARKVANTDK